MKNENPQLAALVRAIIEGDLEAARGLLGAAPELARMRIGVGATRGAPNDYFFPEIIHYLYEGDTALHAAAAAYRKDIVLELLRCGAEVGASNRRKAQPLHYAADGGPGAPHWNPEAQAETIECLVEAGASVEAVDANGASALHRAVRCRCARAVEALLRKGAPVGLRNGGGSTAMDLALKNTGRGGTGSPESKAAQREVIELLKSGL